MKKEGLALVWKAGMAILSTTTTKTETDTSSKVVVRALLAPSRQANGWVDRPMGGCLDREQGRGRTNMSQAGSKRGGFSWGLPCEGCGIPPAAACWGLSLWLRTLCPPRGKLACLSQALMKTEGWPPFVAGSPLVQIWK